MNAPVNNAPKQSHHYRADIDGLRAIAVLSVVGFHVFPELVTGGFIGVDIFFVISGFLITSMIVVDVQNSAFNIIDFYTRRINRIFPALILILIAVFVAGWYLFAQENYSELNKHMLWATGFLYNILLLGDGGYFSVTAESRPLLHLWSLSIEEQFYICWPILLMAAWKIRKWQGVLSLVVVTIVISFAVNIITQNKVMVFYSPISRFWELLIGACLACFTLKYQHLNNKLSNTKSILGMLLLILGLAYINKSLIFPGWWALLPTIGSFLLIWAGSQAWINKKILSNKILVWIGLISYPLYLWHWPILSFSRLFNGEALSLQHKVLIIIASIVLATLTYLLVEKHMRAKNHRKIKAIVLVLLMICIGIASFSSYRGYLLSKNDYLLSDLKANKEHTTEKCWDKWLEYTRSKSCYLHDIHELTRPAVCYEDKKPSIAIWGDSHAAALYPGFKKLGIDKNIGIIEVSQAGCPPILDINKEDLHFRDNCNEVNKEVLNSLVKVKPDVIVLHAAWKIDLYSLTDSELALKFGNTIKTIKQNIPEAKVVVIGPVPRWETSPEQVVYLATLKSGASISPIRQKAEQLHELDATLQKISADAGVDFISANKILCNEEGCISKVIEDKQSDFIMCDYGHFTEVGSKSFVDKIKSSVLP